MKIKSAGEAGSLNKLETSIKTPYLAHYFYVINEDLPINELHDRLAEKFDLTKCAVDFSLGSSKITLSKPFCCIEDDREVSFYFSVIGELSLLGIVWQSDDLSEQILDDEILELEETRKAVQSVAGNFLGETTVYAGKQRFDLNDFLQKKSDTTRILSGLLMNSGRLTFANADITDTRHFYGYDIADNRQSVEFLTKDLPHLDLLLHKLKKEVQYFEEQRRAFEEQKTQVDKEINRSLHKKNLIDQNSENYKNELEKEIGKLAELYGKLSNAIYITTSSKTTVERDLRKIRNLDVRISAGNRQSEFSNYCERLFEEHLELLADEQRSLHLSLESAGAAIDLVQTKVELFRGNEAMALQTQTKELLNQNVKIQNELLSLQLAAGVIEFVLIFYYSLKSWDGILTYKLTDLIHPLVKLGTVSTFSLSLVVFTHFVANKIRKKPGGKGMLISGASLAISFALMFVISYIIMGAKK